MNPEFRQRLNTISRNIETANEVAQENIYTFTQQHIDPCIAGIKSCTYDYTAACFPNREDQLRRRRGKSRQQLEYSFDFYDDWENEMNNEGDGTGWGNDELDSLLAGRGAVQPQRQRAMSYGAAGRRKDAEPDPTVIPKSSYFGFLDRIPFIGARGKRYKPSAADLQENPGGVRIRDVEASEPLLEEDEDRETGHGTQRGHARQRSGTAASRSTTTSHSSRGDLIMSDEEDDAVPLDDEFAVMLSRRTTSDDVSSGRSGNRPGISRVSTRTVSGKSTKSNKSRRSSVRIHRDSSERMPMYNDLQIEPPSMADLKRDEERLEQQEELEIIQKREAAAQLAEAKGMSNDHEMKSESARRSSSNLEVLVKTPSRESAKDFSLASPLSGHEADEETEPFPSFVTTPKRSDSPKPP